jgi:hypothetical protein
MRIASQDVLTISMREKIQCVFGLDGYSVYTG